MPNAPNSPCCASFSKVSKYWYMIVEASRMPVPLPMAVRPSTVLVGELSRTDPLTVSATRLRYTPSARLRGSEELVPMRFLDPGEKPPMRF